MRQCAVCGKGYRKSYTRSHSMRQTIVKLRPNLQWLNVGNGRRVKACTNCIRTQAKAPRTAPVAA